MSILKDLKWSALAIFYGCVNNLAAKLYFTLENLEAACLLMLSFASWSWKRCLTFQQHIYSLPHH